MDEDTDDWTQGVWERGCTIHYTTIGVGGMKEYRVPKRKSILDLYRVEVKLFRVPS